MTHWHRWRDIALAYVTVLGTLALLVVVSWWLVLRLVVWASGGEWE